MVEIDNPISSSLALIIRDAAAIADDPHTPLPIPISKDNEEDRWNILPSTNELNIDTVISKTNRLTILILIKYKILKSRVEPNKIIATFKKKNSEILIPGLK